MKLSRRRLQKIIREEIHRLTEIQSQGRDSRKLNTAIMEYTSLVKDCYHKYSRSIDICAEILGDRTFDYMLWEMMPSKEFDFTIKGTFPDELDDDAVGECINAIQNRIDGVNGDTYTRTVTFYAIT